MGFLSKLMKNPMVQMALPFALSAAMPGIGGMFAAGGKLGGLGLGSMFSGMNPMAANALKQSMLGYGTAALTGAKKPGKAALYSGLASIPFSYMSAANAANAFNKDYADIQGMERFTKSGTGLPARVENIQAAGMPPMQRYIPKVDPVEGFRAMTEGPGTVSPKISAMDILTGGKYSIPDTVRTESYKFADDALKSRNPLFGSEGEKEFLYKAIRPGTEIELPSADIFTKMVYDKDQGKMVSKIDPIGTLGPLGLGLLGEYTETEEQRNAEEWARNKERRRKELAFMYGVDPSLIEGEMDNPFYTGAFMNSGGIASLNMDMGGNVSGPGGPKDDMIDAKLSDGEFVMTAKAVENFGNGDRYQGARKMYDMMNMLDPESETMQEVV